MNDSLFIGNGFIDSQLLFIIPFVDGYAKEAKITSLIFEKPLSMEVKSNPVVAEVLNRYLVHEKGSRYKSKTVFRCYRKFTWGLRLLLPAIRLAIVSNRQGLLEDVSWYECQLRHAVWDQALSGSKDGTLDMSLTKRLNAALRVLFSVRRASCLLKANSVKAAVIGHTVYSGRGLVAEFRRNDIDIIAHGANVLHRVLMELDTSHSLMDRVEWEVLVGMVSFAQIEEFWKKRITGQSSYSEAVSAAVSQRAVTTTTPKNIIFLHVFRDSPFYYIDRSRIFSDYVHWIECTLDILKDSEEDWLIKVHPSALRWGEDQIEWLQAIGKQVFGGPWPSHIVIDDGEYSNVELLDRMNRVVTYHGTVHLEAAARGVKPIVISEVSLSSYDQELVLKPSSVTGYKELLLAQSASEKFCLSSEGQLVAQFLLFIREEIQTFTRDVGSRPVFRGDKSSEFEKDLVSVLSRVDQFSQLFQEAGAAVARGLPRTISLLYMEDWVQQYERK